MRHRMIQDIERPFIERIKQLEQRLFGDALSEQKPSILKSADRYSWHFRPSHHIASGLITREDIAFLSQSGHRLLSVGASPAHLERLLLELGVPAQNIVVADRDPALLPSAGPLESVLFDMTETWPELGMFDRIIFPESLCIALSDKITRQADVSSARSSVDPSDPHPTDPLEAELLAHVIRSGLLHLKPGGIIRANGPMSHPKVLKTAVSQLQKEGYDFMVEAQRFFLSVQKNLVTC